MKIDLSKKFEDSLSKLQRIQTKFCNKRRVFIEDWRNSSLGVHKLAKLRVTFSTEEDGAKFHKIGTHDEVY